MDREQELEAIRAEVEKTYNRLNDYVSEIVFGLLDYVYPEHDGRADADAVGELMYVRNSVQMLETICGILESKLTKIIDDSL